MPAIQIEFGKRKERHLASTKATGSLTYIDNGKTRVTSSTCRSNATAKSAEEASKLSEESAYNKVTLKLKEKLSPDIETNVDVKFETTCEILTEPCFYEKNPACTGLVFNESNTFSFQESVRGSVLAVAHGGNGGSYGEGGGGGGSAVLLQNVLFEKDVWYLVNVNGTETSLKQIDQGKECVALAGFNAEGALGGAGGKSSFSWGTDVDVKGVTYTGGKGGNGVDDTKTKPTHGESASPKPNIYLPFLHSTITVGGGGGGSSETLCGSAGFGKGGYAASAEKQEATVKSSFDTGFGSGGGGGDGKGGAGALIIWFSEAEKVVVVEPETKTDLEDTTPEAETTEIPEETVF